MMTYIDCMFQICGSLIMMMEYCTPALHKTHHPYADAYAYTNITDKIWQKTSTLLSLQEIQWEPKTKPESGNTVRITSRFFYKGFLKKKNKMYLTFQPKCEKHVSTQQFESYPCKAARPAQSQQWRWTMFGTLSPWIISNCLPICLSHCSYNCPVTLKQGKDHKRSEVSHVFGYGDFKGVNRGIMLMFKSLIVGNHSVVYSVHLQRVNMKL